MSFFGRENLLEFSRFLKRFSGFSLGFLKFCEDFLDIQDFSRLLRFEVFWSDLPLDFVFRDTAKFIIFHGQWRRKLVAKKCARPV